MKNKNKIKKITASILILLITFFTSTVSNVVSAKTVTFTVTKSSTQTFPSKKTNTKIYKYINAYRKTQNAKPVKPKSDLTAMAKVRAKEISKLFAHKRPNGKSLIDLAYKKGAGEYDLFGENLACTKYFSQINNFEKIIIEGWKKSKAHRRVMKNKKYKYIGCAYYIKDDMIYICTIYGV